MSEAVLRGHPRGAIPRAFTRALCLLGTMRLMRVLWTLILVLSLLALVPAAEAEQPGDIILIVADDMRLDGLTVMPTTAGMGVGYHAIVANPVCCPSRASMLTGLYSHSTGVYGNQPPKGGFAAFDDSDTVATRLDSAGYRTVLFGKYLNGYGGEGYVPPGWDRWHGFKPGGAGSYFDWDAWSWEQGDAETVLVQHPDPADYSTDWIAREASEEIASSEQPLFLYLSPPPPHEPDEPALRHEGAFEGIPPYRPPSFDEADRPDKPEHVRKGPPLTATQIAEIDQRRIDQLETLLSLDELVAQVLTALQQAGRLDTATVIFTSDNGYHWGEHAIPKGKATEYREAHEVPLRILTPGAPPEDHNALAQNVDLAPTIADLAGITWPDREGISLLPNLLDPTAPTRRKALVEHRDGATPAYCQIRTLTQSYVRLTTGEEEFYRYVTDPYELRNRAGARKWADRTRALRRVASKLCWPRPPGFTDDFRGS